ncbi:MAG: hypothetical protein ACI9G1_003417 [Pirellulaceae bacterium]|jgi:hypothetical protein
MYPKRLDQSPVDDVFPVRGREATVELFVNLEEADKMTMPRSRSQLIHGATNSHVAPASLLVMKLILGDESL